MHASVINAQTHRARENLRRRNNRQKQIMHGFIRAYGLNPGYTPPNPEGTHQQRREASRTERRQRRVARNIMFLWWRQFVV